HGSWGTPGGKSVPGDPRTPPALALPHKGGGDDHVPSPLVGEGQGGGAPAEGPPQASDHDIRPRGRGPTGPKEKRAENRPAARPFQGGRRGNPRRHVSC